MQEVKVVQPNFDRTYDTTPSLPVVGIRELVNVLEALRPHLDEDDKVRALFGQFFTSVVSPELLRLEKGNNEMTWNLPVSNLSTEQLMKPSMEEMGKCQGKTNT